MKKRAFLVPVAVAVGAMSIAQVADATIAPVQASNETAVNSTDAAATSELKIQTAPNRLDSFVLTRVPEGTLLAQHTSHASHSSHTSHVSHQSSGY